MPRAEKADVLRHLDGRAAPRPGDEAAGEDEVERAAAELERQIRYKLER